MIGRPSCLSTYLSNYLGELMNSCPESGYGDRFPLPKDPSSFLLLLFAWLHKNERYLNVYKHVHLQATDFRIGVISTFEVILPLTPAVK